MGESVQRITEWVKTHPWIAAVLLGVVVVAAYLYIRSHPSTTVSQTPSTTADTSGAAAGGTPPPDVVPQPTPVPLPEPVPLPITEGGTLGGHHGGGGHGGNLIGQVGGGTNTPPMPIAPGATQPGATTTSGLPQSYTVLGSEIVAVTNPAEYSAGAQINSGHMTALATLPGYQQHLSAEYGQASVAPRNTVTTTPLATMPGYQQHLSAEYGGGGRTASQNQPRALATMPGYQSRLSAEYSPSSQGRPTTIAAVSAAMGPKPPRGRGRQDNTPPRGVGAKVKVR